VPDQVCNIWQSCLEHNNNNNNNSNNNNNNNNNKSIFQCKIWTLNNKKC
jgi:hypothetical protein